MSILYYFRVNELTKLGYKLCNKTRYWFCEYTSSAVSDDVIRIDYSKFKNQELVSTVIHNMTFFTFTTANQDVLDTIYRLHFDKDVPKRMTFKGEEG